MSFSLKCWIVYHRDIERISDSKVKVHLGDVFELDNYIKIVKWYKLIFRVAAPYRCAFGINDLTALEMELIGE